MSEDRPDLDEPLATPEQDAFITSLLAGLGTDDPPMPDYVAARLTAALAAFSQDSVLVPTSSMTLYTLSAMRSS